MERTVIAIILASLLMNSEPAWAWLGEYLLDELDCPGTGTEVMARKVEWGTPGRAYLTLPAGLRIAPSLIPGAGFGIISDTFIKRYTWLSEYEGELVSLRDREYFSEYTWAITRGGELTSYIDGYRLESSSFLRFINTPTRLRDENVLSMECMTKIYYMTSKDIGPGTELLVDYGTNYVLDLDIDLNDYYNVSKAWRKQGLDLNQELYRDMIDTVDLDATELSDDNEPGYLEMVHINDDSG